MYTPPSFPHMYLPYLGRSDTPPGTPPQDKQNPSPFPIVSIVSTPDVTPCGLKVIHTTHFSRTHVSALLLNDTPREDESSSSSCSQVVPKLNTRITLFSYRFLSTGTLPGYFPSSLKLLPCAARCFTMLESYSLQKDPQKIHASYFGNR